MTEHAVVIVGGGPTGLMLAGELALARVDVAIVERRDNQGLAGSRAGGLHARTIEVLDQRGIADRFLAEGQVVQVASFGLGPLDISDFPTRRNYGLALWQNRIEGILAEWVGELGVPIYGGREVTGFAQNDGGVDVELSGGRSLGAQYLVGCDGGKSLVRKQAGIDFPGWDASTSFLIAEVEMTEEPEWGIRRDEKGVYALGKLDDGKRVRVVLREEQVGVGDEPTLAELREALVALYGTDFGVCDVAWLSRFTDMTRQAASYRERRVLLAGDAAHVHSPAGGQGLNTGVQDAVNLGWKLAQVVHATSPESLLDTYHAERHPVGARVLRNTMAITALSRGGARTEALRESLSELLAMNEPRKRYAAMMSGLDVHYDLGRGHPLLGRRMPDLDLITESGPQRAFALLHDARPVLLNLAEPGALDIAPWAERVRLIDARYAGAWELPVLGRVPAPAAVLIRPDGHVAWVGDGTDEGLRDALGTWFGLPALIGAPLRYNRARASPDARRSSMNPKVDAFLKRQNKWRAEFEKLREILLATGLSEELKWGKPCYALDGKNVALIHGFKEYCAILFPQGALLKDPKKVLVQQTEHVQAARQIRFTSVQEVTKLKSTIKAYLREAIQNERAGRKVQMKRTEDFEVPEEFKSKLARNAKLRAAFAALTPGRQRAYIFHFSQPKLSKTRSARVEKHIPRILKRLGLDD